MQIRRKAELDERFSVVSELARKGVAHQKVQRQRSVKGVAALRRGGVEQQGIKGRGIAARVASEAQMAVPGRDECPGQMQADLVGNLQNCWPRCGSPKKATRL